AWLAAAAPPDVQAEGVAKEVRQDSALGKNRDQRGCLQAAGYVWCEGAGKCIRPWKESCPGGTEFCKDYCSKQSKDQPKLRAGAGSHSVYCRCMDNGEAAEYKPKTSGPTAVGAASLEDRRETARLQEAAEKWSPRRSPRLVDDRVAPGPSEVTKRRQQTIEATWDQSSRAACSFSRKATKDFVEHRKTHLNFDQVGEQVEAILRNHSDFLVAKETPVNSGKGLGGSGQFHSARESEAAENRKSSPLRGKADGRKSTSLSGKADDRHKSILTERAPAAAQQEELEIVDAGGADGSDSEEDMEPPKKLQSRSQMRARASFRHIDNGKEDAQAVFALIGAPRLRVDTKLDFFRERAEMVLPPIEEGFMVHN
ncbi:unnamed protein product, partial [Polarella glacialis]